ncbi:SMI1/KNR4 family protein [Riemerella columbipharyngis]|uniref:SMI1/KNR4 family protein n=1 Tax=Riemerella columbipharyngis TaxID=1071918 RepID=UPI001C86D032|nr:SMI1/KNR4 family protein [Riemerella columbipharyngis]
MKTPKGEKIGHVPKLAPLAYNIQLSQKLDFSLINSLEKRLQREIPPAYKRFLMEYSNGLHFYFSLNLYGNRDGLLDRSGNEVIVWDLQDLNRFERPKNSSKDVIFIGTYSYDASKLYIDCATNKVHYCGRYDATSLKEWDSFETMMSEEIDRIYALFDEDGYLTVNSSEKTPYKIE